MLIFEFLELSQGVTCASHRGCVIVILDAVDELGLVQCVYDRSSLLVFSFDRMFFVKNLLLFYDNIVSIPCFEG